MIKNEPIKNHYVPQFYLREFAIPETLNDKYPLVWIFDKNGKNKRKDKVRNILVKNNLYTLKIKGKKDYSIELTLANLEAEYARIFHNKIKNKIPLSEKEHILLCAFVSVMFQRTLRHKDNLESSYDRLIEHCEAIERAHNIPPNKSEELKKYKENTHKTGVIRLLPDITEILVKMNLAFLCAEGDSRFITSDDPCNLFNPDLQWQRFYGPGFAQKNIQITLPLSPKIKLCMSWNDFFRGYMNWNKKRVNESNRMIVGHSYKYFISHTPKIKRAWLRYYPLDFFFILKILRHKKEMLLFNLKRKYKYGIRRK